jgi:hypothetical protein
MGSFMGILVEAVLSNLMVFYFGSKLKKYNIKSSLPLLPRLSQFLSALKFISETSFLWKFPSRKIY